MSVYDIVLEQITNKLKSGVVPWHQTWKAGMMPMNYISAKPYRGINLLLLAGNPYTSPYYLSFKQLSEKGGSIKAGESGHPVLFFKPVSDRDDGEPSYLVMRYYRVWNIQQTTLHVEEGHPTESRPGCMDIMASMPDKPAITHGLGNPCYIPMEDRILIPPHQEFESGEEYYAALYHELVHSTGHEKRLMRFRKDAMALFGSESYSEEELVAEIGASFLCGMAGILPTTLENNAAYIHNWLQKLSSDKRIFIRAASAAQKAVDYITGHNAVCELETRPAAPVIETV